MAATATKYLVRADRGPQDDDELWWYVRSVWGVTIPRQRVCSHHQAPFEAFAHAYFARSPMALWKASRGFGGKSFLLALLGMTEMATLGAQVSILGGSGQQSRRVHEAMQQFWQAHYAPRNLLAKDPTQYETHLSNGGRCVALMASQGSVRGPHPHRLRLDEIDEMDQTILDASLGQPMGSAGIPAQVVMSSTHQYPDGTMTEMYRRAHAQGWPTWEWCYKETLEPYGWLPPSEVELKRSVVPALMWDTEYEGQEPSGGHRAIVPAAVEAMFDPARGEYDGAHGEYLEFAPPAGEDGADEEAPYVTGADWAKEQDWTVIATYHTAPHPWELVCWERLGRERWPRMVASYDARLDRYGGVGAHDNTGLGDVIDDYQQHPDQVHGVQLVGRARQDIFSEYISAIERAELTGPRVTWAYHEHLYVTQRDLSGAGHPPDSLVAGALAYHARQWQMAGEWGLI